MQSLSQSQLGFLSRLWQFYDEYYYINQQITQLFIAGSPQLAESQLITNFHQ